MSIERVKITQGTVNDCETVLRRAVNTEVPRLFGWICKRTYRKNR